MLPLNKVIALWAVPRSRSTAFLRAFFARKDTLVIHEPFFGAYYYGLERGSKRPITEKIKNENSHNSYEVVKKNILTSSKPISFFKDMAFYSWGKIDQDFYKRITNTFIIRNPMDALRSHYKMSPDFFKHEEEAGYFSQLELFNFVTKKLKQPAIIIDADDLCNAPAFIIKKYCEEIGVPYDENSVQWEGKEIPIWEGMSDWHLEAAQSTKFCLPQSPDSSVVLPKAVTELIKKCDEPYRFLYQKRIKPYQNQNIFQPKIDFVKKNIFFDMDGTLCNSETIHIECHEIAIGIMKTKYSLNFVLPNKSLLWKGLRGATVDNARNFILSCCPEIKNYEKEYQELAFNIFLELKKSMGDKYLIKPSVDLLKNLVAEKYKVCIVSGSRRIEIEENIQTMGIVGQVTYLGAEDYRHSKPSPEPYLNAARLFGVKPTRENCVAFEDSGRGVQSAKQAGMFVIGLSYDGNEEDLKIHGADLLVKTLEDAPIKKLFRNFW